MSVSDSYLPPPYRSSFKSPYAFSIHKSDSSSTHVASETDDSSIRKSFTSEYPARELYDERALPDNCLTIKPTRDELNKVLGEDIIPHTTEIASIPCAGVRISHGKLQGLMAWRFVVQLDEPSRKFRSIPRPGVVTNFILDTGSGHSPIPPETLKALGYTGSLKPGNAVTLFVQGIRTRCVVAYPEEAGRLCGLFTTAGSLTFYFDARLDAPVLYVADDNLDTPRPKEVPRTVKVSFQQRVLSMISLGKLPRTKA